jgi:hypothetical protein
VVSKRARSIIKLMSAEGRARIKGIANMAQRVGTSRWSKGYKKAIKDARAQGRKTPGYVELRKRQVAAKLAKEAATRSAAEMALEPKVA